jgi:hypothetical protein
MSNIDSETENKKKRMIEQMMPDMYPEGDDE